MHNAVKHGHPKNILIRLTAEHERGTLLVKDDGTAITGIREHTQGMGLHIMNYRAGMIGGTLEVRPDRVRGTAVVCTFPMRTSE